MMHPVERRFNKARGMRGDCYVADYTEQTASRVGVVIAREKMDDIESFHLQRGRKEVNYLAVNLEEHPAFIKGIPNCECFFVCTSKTDRPWLLFLELKYCKAHNLAMHASKAVTQMAAVLEKLVEERVIDPRAYRIYFNYSSPTNNRRQPFTHFRHTPAEAMALMDRYGAYYLGFNHLIITGPQFLRSPKRRI